MKKILTGFFLIVFGLSAVTADDGVTISRAVSSSKTQTDKTSESAPAAVVARTAVSRGAVVQALPSVDTDSLVPVSDDATVQSSLRANASAQDNAATRATVSRTASRVVGAGTEKPDNLRSGPTVVRPAGVSRSVVGDVSSQRDNLEATVRTVGRNARVTSASINNSAPVRRSGVSLRPSTAEVGGRATIAGTGVQTGSNIANEARSVQSRAAATQTKESITEAKERLQQTADLNKSCQEQYNDCMDQFCSVIDANQKRCSCSSNLSRYTKVEAAVKDANTQLNDVAQRIRYVGLSADEIRAIMSATEAEDVLSGTKDNTESRNMLLEIENLIKNPAGAASSNSGDSFSGLDMNLDFSSGSGDLFSLDFLGSNSSSFSNLRGTDLYNAAKKRCNTVLTQCKTVGATTAQITGNYDLAIDKDCIAYEQGLGKMNDALKKNVASAGNMLQKARLAVMQNKNQYDAKGCIGALSTCMADDMVCGADYTKCLDPTKTYIDENGKVVLGQNISNIIKSMTDYDNSKINKEFLKSSSTADLTQCTTDAYNNGSCVVRYLLTKIGTGKTVTDGGLCRAVLDKCQRYTYNSSNVYEPYNDVVVNYVQRAMVNIQSAQQKIISDYASGCMVDIATCYNQQVSQVNSWSSTASINSVYNVMRGACRNIALTCSYAVFAYDTESCPTTTTTTTTTTESDNQAICINNISKIFYQSLLCPDNSSYQEEEKTEIATDYVNDRCKCDTGYIVFGKSCVSKCIAGTYRNQTTGQCDSCPAGKYSNTADASSCTACSAGSYCPKGSSEQTNCSAGFYCPAGSASQIKCPAGTTSVAGSDASTACTKS